MFDAPTKTISSIAISDWFNTAVDEVADSFSKAADLKKLLGKKISPDRMRFKAGINADKGMSLGINPRAPALIALTTKDWSEQLEKITEFLDKSSLYFVVAKSGDEILATMVGDEGHIIKALIGAIDKSREIEKTVKSAIMAQIIKKMAKDED